MSRWHLTFHPTFFLHKVDLHILHRCLTGQGIGVFCVYLLMSQQPYWRWDFPVELLSHLCSCGQINKPFLKCVVMQARAQPASKACLGS